MLNHLLSFNFTITSVELLQWALSVHHFCDVRNCTLCNRTFRNRRFTILTFLCLFYQLLTTDFIKISIVSSPISSRLSPLWRQKPEYPKVYGASSPVFTLLALSASLNNCYSKKMLYLDSMHHALTIQAILLATFSISTLFSDVSLWPRVGECNTGAEKTTPSLVGWRLRKFLLMV